LSLATWTGNIFASRLPADDSLTGINNNPSSVAFGSWLRAEAQGGINSPSTFANNNLFWRFLPEPIFSRKCLVLRNYRAWIRTMNNASKGRCVTVTPRGKEQILPLVKANPTHRK
jgi:hypothetical protein